MQDMMKKCKEQPLILLGVFVAIVLAMILCSYFLLHIPIVAVCTLVILETLLSALLNRIPLWIHGICVIAQIVAGIMVGKVVFMILMVVVYCAAAALLYMWSVQEA